MVFRDRQDAGRQLAGRLAGYDFDDPVVLALPRGGVPVGYEIAHALRAPLDVLIVRKIGAPFQPELGVGAIAEGGEAIFDEQTMAALRLSPDDLADIVADERAELERRLRRYRGGRKAVDVTGRTVIVVDDGLATGATARAALEALRGRAIGRLILAVPTCAAQTAKALRSDADDVVCLLVPDNFGAVGRWYERFDQTSDETVVDLLQRAREALPSG